jgi:aminomethyltransferase
MNETYRYHELLACREHYRTASLHTPFHRWLSALNQAQAWRRWNGYLVAERFGDSELEHAALRNTCTVADVSPLAKYRVSGPDARRVLERLLTGRIGTLSAGEARYVLMCNGEGQLLDDGVLFHLQPGEYRLCCRHYHLDWLLLTAAGFDATVQDESHDVAGLSLQGPTSCALLRRLALPEVQHLAPNTLAHYRLDGTAITVSRTGFSGDLGYEVWMPWTQAEPVWQRLFEHRDTGLTPIGTDAQNLARLEAGYVMSEYEYLPADRVVSGGAARTPLELGLERYIDFDRPAFNGRRALAAQAAAGPPRRLLPMLVDGSVPATGAIVYNYRRRRVGVVTSAASSPAAKQNIALALLDAPWGRTTDTLWADIHYAGELDRHRRRVRVRPHAAPFYDPVRRRVTPAGNH